MDPTACLTKIRQLIREIEDFRADWDDPQPTQGPVLMVTLGAELADHVEALDEWIKGGGFLPEQWRK